MPRLPFISEVPEFKPRKHIGQDSALSKVNSDIIDGLDVTEQKSDYAVKTAVTCYNAVWLLGLFHVLGVIVIVAALTNSSALGAVVKIVKTLLP